MLPRPAIEALSRYFPWDETSTARLETDALASLDAVVRQTDPEREHLIGCRVAVGRVVEEIATAAQKADLLLLGSRGENTLQDHLLGSTAERLLGRSPVPLLVVRQPPTRAYRRVVVALDLSPHSAETLAWAQAIAPGAELLLVHGFDLPYAGKLWLAGVSDEQIRHYQWNAQQQARAQLTALVSQAGLSAAGVRQVVEQADVPRLILDQCHGCDADLLVLGRRQRSSLEDVLLGSVTRHVLADAPCDMLVVQPGASTD